MDIAEWLSGMVKPLVTRVLVALGFGTVTYTGADAAINGLISNVASTMGGLTADIAALAAMGGFFDAIAISSGSLVTAVTMLTLKKFALDT